MIEGHSIEGNVLFWVIAYPPDGMLSERMSIRPRFDTPTDKSAGASILLIFLSSRLLFLRARKIMYPIINLESDELIASTFLFLEREKREKPVFLEQENLLIYRNDLE